MPRTLRFVAFALIAAFGLGAAAPAATGYRSAVTTTASGGTGATGMCSVCWEPA